MGTPSFTFTQEGLKKGLGDLFYCDVPSEKSDRDEWMVEPSEEIEKIHKVTDLNKQITANWLQWQLLGVGSSLLSSQVAGDFVGTAPDAWIGWCPLEIVTYYDFAESDSVVKYRAFGGEYFAHQGGDKNAMRVDFLLVGPWKEVIMNLLRLMRFRSSSQTVGQPLFNTDESYIKQGPNMGHGEGLWTIAKVRRRRATEMTLNTIGLSKLSYTDLVSTLGLDPNILPDKASWDAMTPVQKQALLEDPHSPWDKLDEDTMEKLQKTGWSANKTMGGDYGRWEQRNDQYYSLVPNTNVDPNSIEKYVFQDQKFDTGAGEYVIHGDQFYQLQNLGYYTFHYNYPVIIKNMIFNNMWIETVQFTHDSKDGIDAIRGHLLLRKYMRPPKLRWSANGQNVTAMNYRKSQNQLVHSDSLVGTQDTTTGAKKEKVVTQDKYIEKYGATPTDKKVWVWEEKMDNKPQISEIISNFSIGIAKAMTKAAINIGQNRGFGTLGPDNVTSIVSRVTV
jgi:hypothetical protein